MGLAILALLISVATGYAVLTCLWPRSRPSSSGRILRLSLAGGLGLFLSSLTYLACLSVGLADRSWLISMDLAVLAGVAALARHRDRSAAGAETDDRKCAPARRFGRMDWFFAFGLISALVANIGAWVLRFSDRPLGFWDAFAIWNLKARFFYLESGEHWLRAFSETISWSHTDYPLMLPLSVARLWTYGAGADQAIPALLGVFFALLIGALLFGAVASFRGRPMGFLAVLALLATPSFMGQVVWQLADIPMSYFLAAALALVVTSRRQGEASSGLLVVAGVLAGSAAWTKNEGLLFALAIALGLILADGMQAYRRANRTPQNGDGRDGRALYMSLGSALFFVIGLALPLAVLLSMKFMVGGENDLATDFTVDSLGRIFVLARHGEILVSFARTLLILTGVPLLVLIVGLCSWAAFGKRIREKPPLFPALIAIALQLSGYYFVFLVTERDLVWHLDTSNLRLFVQLWPSVLLLVFLGLPPLGDGLGDGRRDELREEE
jgi:hypothetical protein